MEAKRAWRMASTKALRSPRYLPRGPLRTLEAATRSSLMAEMHRAKTASAMVGAGMPRSSADWLAHLPVPFWPAASLMSSTRGRPVSGSILAKMSLVIWMR